jgi:hypothetical protein
MANRFGADILIQALDPKKAALFYVNHLGFEITDNNPKMIGLHSGKTFERVRRSQRAKFPAGGSRLRGASEKARFSGPALKGSPSRHS